MTLSFRRRIVLTLLPLLLLLAALGAVATVLIYRLGGRIDAILRENYDSVRYMQELREAVEKIDSAFQLANAGVEDIRARREYAASWTTFEERLRDERNNITLPGEQEQADELDRLGRLYRGLADRFFDELPPRSSQRLTAYLQPGGLRDTYDALKRTSQAILEMNQKNMEEAEDHARRTAARSLGGFGLALAATVLLGAWLAWNVIRSTLRPIELITESVQAVGRGNLDQVVPVVEGDELGRLAAAFNAMARQLREYRQSDYARLLRAQQTSQATIDSFPDPVVVVDAAGQVERANPAAQRILGVQGRPTETLSADLVPLVRRAIDTNEPWLPETFDRVLRRIVTGEERFFLPRVLPIAAPTGEALGAAVLLEDVTRFRLLDQVKSDLVATVSHELKTPLTSIRLALHLLLEEVIGPLTPKQTELLVDARDNGERLLRMVNNLLDLARLEKGKVALDLRPERPIELVAPAVELLRPRAEDKGVALVLRVPDDLPAVAADAPRLGHALGNLLDNALACTAPGGRIEVTAASDGATVVLAVTDTGIGIPSEHLPHLFDKFYRIPGRGREGGSGLGLAIAREVVQAHGGTIEVESAPGVGSTFRIVLPIWKEGSR